MDFQRTVARVLKFRGVGLHTGKIVEIEIWPMEAGSGISFQRTDLSGSEPIRAIPQNICATELNTTIGHGQATVSTIEHLMAAFSGLGIENALVKVNAPELPILDGSAAPFVDLLLIAGSKRLDKPKVLKKTNLHFKVTHGESFMGISPALDASLTLNCSIDFDKVSPVIGQQTLSFYYDQESFFELCEARTFCHIKDVEYMRSRGLALGGALDNAVVVDNEKVINAEGLRYPDEFVRHKILDCIGDLSLLNFRLAGVITIHKAGHFLHAKFMKELLQNAHLLSEINDESFDSKPLSEKSSINPLLQASRL